MSRLAHPRTLIVVLVLPLLVVGLGMWALSGRVDRLDSVPAAVVNLDEGAEVTAADGSTQTVPFGRLLAGALTQPGTVEGQDAPATTGFDWRLTSQEDAEQGLTDGTYAAVVVIPADFSEDLATLGTPEATSAILEVTTDDASGQINALVATAVAEASSSTMGGDLAAQYLDGLYLGFNDLHSGFSDAADGARELADGTSALDDGAQELAGGTRELADGSAEAADGAREFSGGVWSLADGTWQAADGTRELADGLDDLADGTDELAGGVSGLQQGMRGTADQPGLVDGAQQLADGVEGDGTAANPGLAAGADQLADGLEQVADGVERTGGAVSGDGTAENPGLLPTARSVAQGTEELGQGAQEAADGLNGTAQQPGLVQAADGVVGYAEGVDQTAAGLDAIVDGDGTAENPGMSALSGSLEESACALAERYPEDPQAQAACQQATGMSGYVGGVDEAAGGLHTVVDGDGTDENPGLMATAQGVGDGARTAADGVQQLADGVNGTEDSPGLVQGTQGVVTYAEGLDTAFDGDGSAENPGLVAATGQLAEGARSSADGAAQLTDGVTGLRDGLVQYADGVDQLADGADQLAEGTRAAADGADELADGTGALASGADELGTGADRLADGSRQLADGTSELADGTEELADGTGELADGGDELADGLREGADEIPTYSESERTRMGEMAASPVGTEVQRQNEADGADTATFPFVTALALWLGAFASFLLLPALRRALLDRALPMWRVVLRSLAPALLIAVVQAVAALALLTGIGIAPVSPLAVGLVALAGAVMFAALHQALLTVLGARIGRIASIVLMVLQVVTLVGIVPVETAPALLQDVGALMPLSIVTQGLVHAALGGTLVSTSSTLLSILAWAAISLLLTLVASRGARRADRSEHVGARALPATA
ncbi:YhgE/Pip domain-containing protein [Brachybacterium saurashtrense]|uniref:YhgE/Pip domain-containing protein n=1 Tax=Brachybacterium saurashtrense TaxID=556288 RepID=A0A345YME9_9MICO|nr:YhgE/Pip domain-containing protein [Brachybacterium saurashtrense]AXK45101.1 YhgE/Pip domain-containing protein [Brachybacterium saurashtrense]RRR22146.1 YhgE/Pip domain-containing protein [Brachybacterium saurashtrense]